VTDRVPNVIELGRKPNPCRYVWTAYNNEEQLRQGATWVSLKRAVDELEECTVVILDLYTTEAEVIQDISQFLEHWRANYFDDAWSFMK
jgi:hypothetical protein